MDHSCSRKRTRPLGRRTLSVDRGIAELYGRKPEGSSELPTDKDSDVESDVVQREIPRRNSAPSLPTATWKVLDGNSTYNPAALRDSWVSPHNSNTTRRFETQVPSTLEACLKTNLPIPTATQDSGVYTTSYPFIRGALLTNGFDIRTQKHEVTFYEPYYGPPEHAIRADAMDVSSDRTVPSPVKMSPQTYNPNWRQREEYAEKRKRQKEQRAEAQRKQWERKKERAIRVATRWGSAEQWRWCTKPTVAE
ncbi:hypothetical protein BU16DRAFT_545518 [Lophium mytilinum]|uniref:Uncharacterized protein n=1 Tax=Lophium mytilinum TaxID=390894 RepID=A0A6A6Q984_9PEZI|nr:hypothetical protein BU16DRAFT_545518 [Lophium mytilinum]